MPDTLTPEQRRYCMSRVKSKNTEPELILRKALWKRGHRYRIHYNTPGKPDLVFVSARVAVFVDGCFWHGCPKHCTLPKTNSEFWSKKILNNIKRDVFVAEELHQLGWEVLRFWEHEVRLELDSVIRKIELKLQEKRL